MNGAAVCMLVLIQPQHGTPHPSIQQCLTFHRSKLSGTSLEIRTILAAHGVEWRWYRSVLVAEAVDCRHGNGGFLTEQVEKAWFCSSDDGVHSVIGCRFQDGLRSDVGRSQGENRYEIHPVGTPIDPLDTPSRFDNLDHLPNGPVRHRDGFI